MDSHILVTGGSRGIGAAIVRLAVAAGYRVTYTYRADDGGADALTHELGSRVRAVRADLREADDAARVVAEAVSAFGALHGLVNNAGITGRLGGFLDTTIDDVRDLFAVNVIGTVAMCRAVVERWAESDAPGVIVTISSTAASTGAPGEYVGYAASKAAVETLTIGLGRELGPRGIRVVGVAPGTTNTTIHERAGDAGRPARVAARVPLGRVAEPEEIARVVLFALSEDASFVTGTTIAVAGGL